MVDCKNFSTICEGTRKPEHTEEVGNNITGRVVTLVTGGALVLESSHPGFSNRLSGRIQRFNFILKLPLH